MSEYQEPFDADDFEWVNAWATAKDKPANGAAVNGKPAAPPAAIADRWPETPVAAAKTQPVARYAAATVTATLASGPWIMPRAQPTTDASAAATAAAEIEAPVAIDVESDPVSRPKRIIDPELATHPATRRFFASLRAGGETDVKAPATAIARTEPATAPALAAQPVPIVQDVPVVAPTMQNTTVRDALAVPVVTKSPAIEPPTPRPALAPEPERIRSEAVVMLPVRTPAPVRVPEPNRLARMLAELQARKPRTNRPANDTATTSPALTKCDAVADARAPVIVTAAKPATIVRASETFGGPPPVVVPAMQPAVVPPPQTIAATPPAVEPPLIEVRPEAVPIAPDQLERDIADIEAARATLDAPPFILVDPRRVRARRPRWTRKPEAILVGGVVALTLLLAVGAVASLASLAR